MAGLNKTKRNRLNQMNNDVMIELPKISAVVEIPESLNDRAVEFIEGHKSWDYDRMVAAALILFLANQNGYP